MNYFKMGEAALKRFDEAWGGASPKVRSKLLEILLARSDACALSAAPPIIPQTVNETPIVATKIEQVEAAPANEVPYEPVQTGGVREADIQALEGRAISKEGEAQFEERMKEAMAHPSTFAEAVRTFGLTPDPFQEKFDAARKERESREAFPWPEETELLIYGWANNPRLMLAELPDKRKVSVWRAPRQYRLPQKFKCKLDVKNPGNPIYMVL